MSADVYGAGTFASVEEAVTFAAVTASLNLADRERIAVTGFDGYIQKPTDPETFVGKIERLLPETGPPPAIGAGSAERNVFRSG